MAKLSVAMGHRSRPTRQLVRRNSERERPPSRRKARRQRRSAMLCKLKPRRNQPRPRSRVAKCRRALVERSSWMQRTSPSIWRRSRCSRRYGLRSAVLAFSGGSPSGTARRFCCSGARRFSLRSRRAHPRCSQYSRGLKSRRRKRQCLRSSGLVWLSSPGAGRQPAAWRRAHDEPDRQHRSSERRAGAPARRRESSRRRRGGTRAPDRVRVDPAPDSPRTHRRAHAQHSSS